MLYVDWFKLACSSLNQLLGKIIDRLNFGVYINQSLLSKREWGQSHLDHVVYFTDQ